MKQMPLKFWIISAVIVSICVAVVVFFVRNTLYIVDASTTNRQGYTVKLDGESSVTTLLGISIVPRATAQIVVSERASDIPRETSISLIDKPLLLPKKITVPLQDQRAVAKVGTASLGCDFGTETAVYNINCSDPTSVSKLRGDDQWGNVEVASLMSVPMGIHTYKTGLLVVGSNLELPDEATVPNVITYIENGTVTAERAISLDGFAPGGTLQFTTDSGGGDGFTILDRNNGKLHVFSSLTATPRVIDFKRELTASELRICAINTVIACYEGLINQGADAQEGAEALKEQKPGSLSTWDFQGKKLSDVATNKNFGIDSLCVTSKKDVYIESANTLYRLPDLNRPKLDKLAVNVSNVNCADQIVYTKNAGIYTLDGQVSHLVFESKKHIISNLSSIGGRTFFNTFISGDPSGILHSFRLTGNAVTTPRKEDTLPYVTSDETPIVTMDYDDTRMYFQLIASPISNRQTGTFTADPIEFEDNKQKVISQLTRDNLLKSNPELIFRF